MNEEPSLNKHLVRFHDPDSTAYVGMGVLLPQGYVVTCLHVVSFALGQGEHDPVEDGETVTVSFPFGPSPKHQTRATLTEQRPYETDGIGDLAILKIDDLPFSVDHSPFVHQPHPHGLPVELFGCPENHPRGTHCRGILRDAVAGGLIHIDCERDTGNVIRRVSVEPVSSTVTMFSSLGFSLRLIRSVPLR